VPLATAFATLLVGATCAVAWGMRGHVRRGAMVAFLSVSARGCFITMEARAARVERHALVTSVSCSPLFGECLARW